MITFDEALRIVRDVAHPLGTETVPLAEADGRVLAEPVLAAVPSPPADVSAMDGYAVSDADLATLPVRLEVAGESFAGTAAPPPLRERTTARIFTGAPVPAGADRVVIQENVRREGDAAIFEIRPGPGRHIRARASDFGVGDLLVPKGRRLGARSLVAIAAADCAEVRAYRRPRVVVLATGDELADPGAARDRPGAIPESVSVGVLALARQWGAVSVGRQRLPDDLPSMGERARQAAAEADLVVVTGGASVGEKDFAKAMFGPALDILFAKVAIKPGKPVWLGRTGGTLVVGLPGNPTSALVTARLLLAPLLCGLGGRDAAEALRWRPAPLGQALPPTGARETFARGRWQDEAAVLLPSQDSGAQKMLVDADLLIRLPAGERDHRPGEIVDVLDF